MITAEDKIKYPNHADGAILGIKLIGGLDDEVLLLVANKDESWEDYFEAINFLMGSGTNPNWITARVAEELYDRDLIDEQRLDELTR